MANIIFKNMNMNIAGTKFTDIKFTPTQILYGYLKRGKNVVIGFSSVSMLSLIAIAETNDTIDNFMNPLLIYPAGEVHFCKKRREIVAVFVNNRGQEVATRFIDDLLFLNIAKTVEMFSTFITDEWSYCK